MSASDKAQRYNQLRRLGIAPTLALALALGLAPNAQAVTSPVSRETKASLTTTVGTASVQLDVFSHSDGRRVTVDSVSTISTRPVTEVIEVYRRGGTGFVRTTVVQCGGPGYAIPAWLQVGVPQAQHQDSGYVRVVLTQGRAARQVVDIYI